VLLDGIIFILNYPSGRIVSSNCSTKTDRRPTSSLSMQLLKLGYLQ